MGEHFCPENSVNQTRNTCCGYQEYVQEKCKYGVGVGNQSCSALR